MNVANVTSRFALLAGLEDDEIYRWKMLVDDACGYIESIVIKDDCGADDKKRLEMLCAAYAFRLYSLCGSEGKTDSFTAGDVHITSSAADGAERAEKLWREYAEKSDDLIDLNRSEFLFGRVI